MTVGVSSRILRTRSRSGTSTPTVGKRRPAPWPVGTSPKRNNAPTCPPTTPGSRPARSGRCRDRRAGFDADHLLVCQRDDRPNRRPGGHSPHRNQPNEEHIMSAKDIKPTDPDIETEQDQAESDQGHKTERKSNGWKRP